ncbi:hypothetical protein UA24_01975 [Marinomonas sp. BSi20414]|nr:hypothetical protein [Marinomonas sp. BSi20414]
MREARPLFHNKKAVESDAFTVGRGFSPTRNSASVQTQKVKFTKHQVPSPFVFKGKAEDGVNLWIFKYICYLSTLPSLQTGFRSAERVTFAQIRKSNQKVSLRSLMPDFRQRYMTVPLRSLYRKA